MTAELFRKSKTLIPGGVNSPVRAFQSVGRDPVFIASANGPFITDSQGGTYIDYVCSWGPMILGHNHPAIREAVIKAAEKGTSFGACTEAELELAEIICGAIPSIDMLRLVNSGTEAAMSAVRLARGATGRDFIIKFRGCYHGHCDSFLIEAGSGAMTFGQPSSPGVTVGTAKDTLLANYNDAASVERLFDIHMGQVACLIVEPVAGNMGVVPPAQDFLQKLRTLCDSHGALLIFDEVITGFRLGLQGAQGHYSVKPDLTVLGKIIGGGLPLGAYGGRKDIMLQLSPTGPVYQAGTLSGNPLATAAGKAAIQQLQTPGFYSRLAAMSEKWETGLRKVLETSALPHTINRVGSLMTLFFNPGPVTHYEDATKSNTEKYAAWFRAMLKNRVYLAPSQFEAAFLSGAHSDEILDRTTAAVVASLGEIN